MNFAGFYYYYSLDNIIIFFFKINVLEKGGYCIIKSYNIYLYWIYINEFLNI